MSTEVAQQQASRLNPASCNFTINGKRYVWHTPSRSPARRSRAAVFRIQTKVAAENRRIREAGDQIEAIMANAAHHLDFTVDVLEFFAEFHAELRDDLPKIYDALDREDIKDKEIEAAFNVVQEFLLRPLVKTAKTDAENESDTSDSKTLSESSSITTPSSPESAESPST